MVVHGDFREPEPGVLKLLDELETDGPARRAKVDRVEHPPPDQTKIAIDVPEVESEARADDVVIEPADDPPMKRIGTVDLVAVDDIDVG